MRVGYSGGSEFQVHIIMLQKVRLVFIQIFCLFFSLINLISIHFKEFFLCFLFHLSCYFFMYSFSLNLCFDFSIVLG